MARRLLFHLRIGSHAGSATFKEKKAMNNPLVYSPPNGLDQFFSDFDNALPARNGFTPAVDVVEEKEDYVLRAELPGVAKETSRSK